MTKVHDYLDFHDFHSSTSEISRIQDEVFEFTSQREARKTPFNVEAFFRATCIATGTSGATRVSKISEFFNRVFLVKFEKGSEAVARFPAQLAGPPHYATASEVATTEFLRRRTSIPVLAWNSCASTHEVGAEFIFMEKAPGKFLYDGANDSPLSPKEGILLASKLIEFEKRILGVRFSVYGAMYLFLSGHPEIAAATTFLGS